MFLVSNCARRYLFTATFLLGLSGCANVYRDFGDKGSDAYRIHHARDAMDKLDFNSAIVAIGPVLSSQPLNADVVYLASAAYAGRAGLRILDLLAAIPSGLGSKGLIAIFAEAMHDQNDAKIADVEKAIKIIENYADSAADRTTNLNFYALFLYYARIGALVNRYAYDSDETLRTNFSACVLTEDLDGTATGLPHEVVDKIMISLPRIIDAASLVIGGGAGLDSVLSTDITAALGQSAPLVPYPCSSATGNEKLVCSAVRTLVNRGHDQSGGIGVGAPGNVSGSEATGVCFYP